MAINNINALVDLEGLEKLQNSDYVSKYYNAGLANQGQRYTNEVLLEYNTFKIADLIAFKYYNQENNPYEHIPYDNESYLIIGQKDQTQNFSLNNLSFKVTTKNQYGNYANIFDLENESNFDDISNTEIKNVLFSKKLWIIKKLYEQVIKDIASDPKNKDDYQNILNNPNLRDDVYGNSKVAYNNLQLWIPIDYEFEYVCDGINKTIIYGGRNNIPVYIEPNLNGNEPANIASDPNKKGIIFIQLNRKYEKTCIYNFSFTRESEIPTVSRVFVLPFIDDEHCWWINNSWTDISAKSEIPTNLNIILAYLYKTGNSNRFEILSGVNELKGKIIDINYLSSRKIWIKRHNGKSFSIICKLPIIDKIQKTLVNANDEVKADIEKILKNSTIILMTKLTKLLDNEDDDIKKEYKDGLITTIWTYSPNKIYDEYTEESSDYDYITVEKDKDNHNLALDFGEITNFSNLINFKVDSIEQNAPDNYVNRHIIFEQILKNNKQEIVNTSAFAVLQNIKGNNYNSKYVNNFNFSLRYVNNIIGESGDKIEKVANTTDNRYFKVPTEESSNLVTNSIYQKIVNNRTLYYPEYIPNYNVPVFDMSEFLVKDSNVMNKQNILSFTDAGLVYYSYIGTPYDSLDKSILHIGTSNTNINLGEYSLIEDTNKDNFLKHSGLSLDFENTYLNGYTKIKDDLSVGKNIYYEKINWNITEVDSNTIYSTQIIPKFKYISNKNGSIYHEISINSMGSGLNTILTNIESPSFKNYNDPNYLYLNIILSHKIKNIDYYYKYNDLIYINHLIKYLDFDGVINKVISNTNKIIYDTNGEAKFLVSSNNLLTDSIIISASSANKISITVQNIKDLYVGNPLDIIIINKNGSNTLVINEHKSHKIKSIWKLPDVI